MAHVWKVFFDRTGDKSKFPAVNDSAAMIYAIRQGGDNPGDKPGTTVGHGQGENV